MDAAPGMRHLINFPPRRPGGFAAGPTRGDGRGVLQNQGFHRSSLALVRFTAWLVSAAATRLKQTAISIQCRGRSKLDHDFADVLLGCEVAIRIDRVVHAESVVDDRLDVVLRHEVERVFVHRSAADVDAADGQQVEHA